MTEPIDNVHFQELAQREPNDVCRRASCVYDARKEVYELSVWGDEYQVFPSQRMIRRVGEDTQPPHDYFKLFIIHYLLGSRNTQPSNEWISEKDIPGGTTFFRGPHEIPTKLISNRFNNNIIEFKERCSQLNGTPLDMADAAYRFQITTRIPVAVLYWTGDAEFPAESKILYDRTVADHLASDIIYALGVGICERLGELGQPPPT